MIRRACVLLVLLTLPSCAAFVEYHAAGGIKFDNPCKKDQGLDNHSKVTVPFEKLTGAPAPVKKTI